MKDEKVFLSYAWTGEDQVVITERMRMITSALKEAGVSYYFNKDDEKTAAFTSPGEFVRDAIRELEQCTMILVIKSTERRSEGQLMEIGAALAWEKKVVMLQHVSTVGATYLDDPDLSGQLMLWSSEDELLRRLGELL